LVDLYAIANAIFGCETLVLERHDVRRITIPCYNGYPNKLIQKLTALFQLVLDRPVEVTLGENKEPFLFTFMGDRPLASNYTCLFSTGIDSYSAILNAHEKLKMVRGAFVSHRDFRKLKGLCNQFSDHLDGENGIRIDKIDAIDHGQFIRRSRGAFYLIYGLMLENKNVIMGEAGVTMYQPKLTLLDSVTITAHPALLGLVSDVVGIVLGERPNLILPCENMTKAEVVSNCHDDAWIKKTFSCSGTTRFATEAGAANCGTCFSCIIRRLAVEVSGKQDCKYAFDITSDTSRKAYDNILHLLHFSLGMLSDREAIHWYTMEILERYNKVDLFERFAMDNLAGLMLMSDAGKLNNVLAKMRDISVHRVDDSMLRERIEVVRNYQVMMDFSKAI
ncbi:MAG: hypothetical protein ABSE82_15910, partial [Nitrososphaerales archaeon]